MESRVLRSTLRLLDPHNGILNPSPKAQTLGVLGYMGVPAFWETTHVLFHVSLRGNLEVHGNETGLGFRVEGFHRAQKMK